MKHKKLAWVVPVSVAMNSLILVILFNIQCSIDNKSLLCDMINANILSSKNILIVIDKGYLIYFADRRLHYQISLLNI